MTHRHKIGTKYMTRSKHPLEFTVTDQFTVTNSKGEIVREYYSAEMKDFPHTTAGEVPDATIFRGLIK